MSHSFEPQSHGQVGDDRPGSSHAPGKTTLTSRLAARASAEAMPLPPDLRARFEASLGVELGAVRLHTGAESEALVEAEGAHALTYGQDIHFGAGRFAPQDPFGLHLVAHEVAHAAQQAGAAPEVQFKKPGAGADAKEQAADAAAAAMVAGQPFDAAAPEAKALPAPLMTRLRAEHAARRAKHATAVEAASSSGTAAMLSAALHAAAPLFGLTLDASASDLSGFLPATAWGEAELRLHLDKLPPELAADAGVKGAKASAADILAASAELAAEYEPLFASCRGAAGKLDLLQLVDAFIAPAGFGPILDDAFGGKALVTPAELGRLFSARQRALLWEYLRTKRLPDGLFTGSPNGAILPGQRVLMASHMMVNGKVEQREKDGEHTGVFHKGRADNCGHWAQMTWAYAAANPGKDFAGNGNLKKGSTGPTGEVSFGSGEAEQVYLGGFDESLSLEDRHAEYIKKNPELAKTPWGKRRAPLAVARFDKLQAGDWLYVYNANESGEHSVIFAGWVDTTDQVATDPKNGPITYRAARIYHQYDNKAGLSAAGVYRLGSGFSLTHKIFPVTAVRRPAAAAAPPKTQAELLPFSAAAAESANAASLKRHRLEGALVSAALLTSARKLLAELVALEPGQRALCQDILDKHPGSSIGELTVQLALGQRLLREDNVDGKLGISGMGVPSSVTSTLLGKRPLSEFRTP